METIIGRKYYPRDNSYSICLSNPHNWQTGHPTHYSLAGDLIGKTQQETTIASEPFDVLITAHNKVYKMVLVTDSGGLMHCVLFDERGFQPESATEETFDEWTMILPE